MIFLLSIRAEQVEMILVRLTFQQQQRSCYRAMGVPVAKHGNRAVSSKSGSADVLEELKISIQHSPEEAHRSLQESNLCFLFAPLYHQSMKHAVAPRKEIGFRTIFNMLGPLTNPANAKYQLIGVYDQQFAAKMAETLSRLGTTRTLFVTGGEGLDELSITNESTVIEVNGKEISTYTLTPEDVGLKSWYIRRDSSSNSH